MVCVQKYSIAFCLPSLVITKTKGRLRLPLNFLMLPYPLGFLKIITPKNKI